MRVFNVPVAREDAPHRQVTAFQLNNIAGHREKTIKTPIVSHVSTNALLLFSASFTHRKIAQKLIHTVSTIYLTPL